MNMLMCRACGSFVIAVKDGESLIPTKEECPECGGTEFKDNDSDRTIQTVDD